MKLHLGCGHRHLDGWLNIDARTDVNADLVADITNLTSFEDGDAEIIYACHVFEHVPRPQIMEVLQAWRRILKPQGILRLAVPDFAALCELYRKGVPMQRIIGPLQGRQNAAWNKHYMCYDWHLLCTYLTEAGFYGMKYWTPYLVHPAGYDDYSFAEIDDVGISLNVEAIRAG